tara:strand:- start:58869 stop:59069 length:201 start_codon:yes stop_codon:yes gene_type:complete
MKAEIESTEETFMVNGVRTRLWKGTTDKGTEISMFVYFVGSQNQAPEFDELHQMNPPEIIKLKLNL